MCIKKLIPHKDSIVTPTEDNIKLPFVIGVMADFSGQSDIAELAPAEHRFACGPIADRQFLEIDRDNFDRCLKDMQPRVVFNVPDMLMGEGELNVDLTFDRMDAFLPAAIARQIDEASKLLEARKQLNRLQTFDHPSHYDEQQLVSLLEEFGLKVDNGHNTIETSISQIDDRLTEQLRLILHHPAFQRLEATWRGLYHLVFNSEISEYLIIRVLNISKQELGKVLCEQAAWDRNPIYAKIHEREYAQVGGSPYSCIVGDYYFDHHPPDLQLLTVMARISAASHTPFIAGASTSLLKIDSWEDLSLPRDIRRIFSSPEYIAWHQFRDTEESRYVVLTLPRFLARLPYGAKNCPLDEYRFEEEVSTGEHPIYCWSNSAFALAIVIARVVSRYGWLPQISGVESGKALEDLPHHTFSKNNGVSMRECTTEVMLNDILEFQLAEVGLSLLFGFKGKTLFLDVRTLHKPVLYTNLDTRANEILSIKLAHWLHACRFAQYLKIIAREKIGSFTGRIEMQQWLNRWLQRYVLSDPDNASKKEIATRPLALARLELEDNPDETSYRGVLYIQPHYQQPVYLKNPLQLPITLPRAPGGETEEISKPPSGTHATPGATQITVTSESRESVETTRWPQISDGSTGQYSKGGIHLIDVIQVSCGGEMRRLELCEGDLTTMRPADAVDVLVISAFPDDYSPTQSSLIGAFERNGLSVEELSKSKEVDLRESFFCWISREITRRQPGLEFKMYF